VEQIKLSDHALQRVHYFQNGCDKDGMEITNIPHLKFAFAYVVQALRPELGNGLEDYLDAEVRPYIDQIAGKFNAEV